MELRRRQDERVFNLGLKFANIFKLEPKSIPPIFSNTKGIGLCQGATDVFHI